MNRAYQTQADNIVGKMTIDGLDKEVFAAEQTNNDRTIRCIFPPDTRQSTLQSFAVGDGPGALTGFQLLDEARASLPLARSWVIAAIGKIQAIEGRPIRRTPADIAFHAQIETHFKVDIPNVSDAVARDRLRKIRDLYEKIQRVLIVIATDRLVGNPGVPDKAMAPLGGFNGPTSVITIGRGFHNSNANMRPAVLIHEGGHFADASCSHAASEQPAPNGSPIEDRFGTAVNPRRLNYAQLDFNLHMQNAYSFAQCAMHNGLGIDKRPP